MTKKTLKIIPWIIGESSIYSSTIHFMDKEKEEMEESKISIERKSLTEREARELKDRIKSMSHEELVVVAETIPVELCLERMHNELEKAKELKEKIEDAIFSFK